MSDTDKFFEEELLPCPWCGTDEYLGFISSQELYATDFTGRVAVVCNFNVGGCGTTHGFTSGSQSQAAQKWNNRRLYNE